MAGQGRPGRPATGQKRVVTFRPPDPMREQFEAQATALGREKTDCLTEALHDWLAKQERLAKKAQRST